MHKLIARLAIGSFGTLAALTAAADCSVDACSDVYVDQIYVETGVNNWIKTSGTETNLTVCAPDSGIYIRLDGAAAQKKEVLALLMMAQAQDKPVFIRVVDGPRGCQVVYVFLNR